VCGFGPNVELDGRRYTTRVEGFMGNVVSAGPLDMTLCDADGSDADVALSAGTHRLKVVSTEQFQPVITLLRSTADSAAASSEPRDLRVVSDEPSIQELELGPGDAAILRTTRNYNPGWVAELDGERLPVQRVDGWAQGWRVPEGKGGDLVIRYAPEQPYITALFGGLAVAATVLLVALVLLGLTRLAPGRQPDPLPPSRRRRARSPAVTAAVLAVAGVLSWVVGGVPALAGMAIALLCWLAGARRTALVLAGLLHVAAPEWAGAAVRSRRSAEAPGT
jgi:arabinofuranan 3-O-arabinosyltransferase